MSLRSTSTLFYYENAAGSLRGDTRGFLHLVWNAGAALDQDRHLIFEHLLTWLQQHDTGKVLVDQRQMTPFSTATQVWLLGEWMPRAVASRSFRHRAILAAHDVFTRLATAAVVAPAWKQINSRYFNEEKEAVAWLVAQ